MNKLLVLVSVLMLAGCTNNLSKVEAKRLVESERGGVLHASVGKVCDGYIEVRGITTEGHKAQVDYAIVWVGKDCRSALPYIEHSTFSRDDEGVWR